MVNYFESKKKFWVFNCPGTCKGCVLYKLKPKKCAWAKAYKQEEEKIEKVMALISCVIPAG